MGSRETALRVIPRGNVTIVAGTCQEREWLLACEWREKAGFLALVVDPALAGETAAIHVTLVGEWENGPILLLLEVVRVGGREVAEGALSRGRVGEHADRAGEGVLAEVSRTVELSRFRSAGGVSAVYVEWGDDDGDIDGNGDRDIDSKGQDKATDRVIDKSIDKPIDKSIDIPINKPIDKSIDIPIDKSIDKPIDIPINKPINKPNHPPMDKSPHPDTKPTLGLLSFPHVFPQFSHPDFLFQIPSQQWTFLHGTPQPPHSLYAAELTPGGTLILPPAISPPIPPSLQHTVNFRGGSFLSLQQFLDETPAYLGLRHAIQPSFPRQLRSCRQVFQTHFRGNVPHTSLSFWRGRFARKPLLNSGAALWQLFPRERRISRFAALEEVAREVEFWREEDGDPLELALPLVERVTCSLDFRNQDFFGDASLRGSILKRRADGEYEIPADMLDLVSFNETVETVSLGRTAVFFWMDNRGVQEFLRGHDARLRSQKRADFRSQSMPDLERKSGRVQNQNGADSNNGVPSGDNGADGDNRVNDNKNGAHDGNEVIDKNGVSDNKNAHDTTINHNPNAVHSAQNPPNSRRLTDSYGESLAHSAVVLQRRFGMAQRRVPAHMPHLLRRSVLAQLGADLAREVNETVARRFRSGEDLQFAFVYFHWLAGRSRETRELRAEQQLRELLDVKEHVGEAAFRLLSRRVCGEEEGKCVSQLLQCVVNASQPLAEREWREKGRVAVRKVLQRPIDVRDLARCDMVLAAMDMDHWSEVEQRSDNAVAFQMISDDLNDTLRQVGGEGSVRGSSTACGGGSPSLCVLTTM